MYAGKVVDTVHLATVRNRPQQARSRARFERLLDAAEAILTEAGYDALNTNAVAARAKTSVGTLYHYFPDKTALLAALVARYNEGYVEVLTGLHENLEPHLELTSYIDQVRQALHVFDQSHPGQGVAFHHALTEFSGFEALNGAVYESVASIFASYFQKRESALSAERAALIARTIIVAYEGLSFTTPGSEAVAPELEGEVQTMIVVYLKQALAEAEQS